MPPPQLTTTTWFPAGCAVSGGGPAAHRPPAAPQRVGLRVPHRSGSGHGARGGLHMGGGEGGGFTVNTAPPPPPHRSRRAVLARPLFSGAPARGRCVAGDVCKQTARPRSPLPAWRESSPPPPPLQKTHPNSPLCNGEGSLGGRGGVHCSLGGTVALKGGILWSQGGPYNLGETCGPGGVPIV